MSPRFFFSPIVIATTLSIANAHAAGPRLSGNVKDSSAHPISGVRISLASAPDVGLGITDSNGSWSFNPTGVARRIATEQNGSRSNIFLVDGRLQLRFDGASIDGRTPFQRKDASTARTTDLSTSAASRARAAADTLLFRFDGEIKARKPFVAGADSNLGTTVIDVRGTFTDPRDGKIYGTTWIRSQKWLTRNLEYKVDSSWSYYPSPDSTRRHGLLYSWAAAMALDDSCNRAACLDRIRTPHQGACPTGWHVPTQREWRTLAQVGENALKSRETKVRPYRETKEVCQFDDLYRPINCNWVPTGDTIRVGSDAWGFHAYNSGYRNYLGNKDAAQDSSFWWTTDHLDTDYEDYLLLFTIEPTAARAWKFANALTYPAEHKAIPKTFGLSLRCLKD